MSAILTIMEVGIICFANLLKNAASTNTGMKPQKHCLYLIQLHLILCERSSDKSGFTFTRITESKYLRLWKPPDNSSKLFSKTGKNFHAKTSNSSRQELLQAGPRNKTLQNYGLSITEQQLKKEDKSKGLWKLRYCSQFKLIFEQMMGCK